MASLSTVSGNAIGKTLLLFFVLCAPAAFANTSLFMDSRVCTLALPYCKELSFYGLLIGNTADTLTLNGNTTGGWTINGGIAIGGTSTNGSNFNRGATVTNSNTVNGPIDFADTVTYNSMNCNATAGTNYCGTATLNGSTPSNTNASRVNSAESQLDSILTQLATYNTGTPGTFGATGTINVSTVNGSSTLDIFRNTGNYSTSGNITLGCGGTTCAANQLVVIVLAGTGNQSFSHSISLADGLQSDQVIFYIPSGNLLIQPSVAASTVNGDFFLAKSGGAHVIGGTGGSSDPVALVGRLFADDGTLTFNNKGGSQTDLGAIPEPGTWAMMAGGFGLLVWQARRRKRAASNRE